jgi:hypothetical protein
MTEKRKATTEKVVKNNSDIAHSAQPSDWGCLLNNTI